MRQRRIGSHVLQLEPIREEDFETLLSWIDSPEFLLQWAGPVFTYPLDEAQLRDHLADEERRRAYRATEPSGRMVGYVELNGLDPRNDSASVSRVLVGPDDRGRGVGTAMVRVVLQIGFEDVGLHRVDLRVFEFNEAAIACYERVGFQHEGRFRDARRFEDEYWTLVQMSILEDEWADSRR